MINRRTFLAAAAAATRVQGAPVRDTPLRANFFGPLYYDQKERAELLEVLETGRPFRWYGPGNEPPRKVATFEREFARGVRNLNRALAPAADQLLSASAST